MKVREIGVEGNREKGGPKKKLVIVIRGDIKECEVNWKKIMDILREKIKLADSVCVVYKCR